MYVDLKNLLTRLTGYLPFFFGVKKYCKMKALNQNYMELFLGLHAENFNLKRKNNKTGHRNAKKV